MRENNQLKMINGKWTFQSFRFEYLHETYVYFDILLELWQWVLKFGTNVLIEEMINAVIHQNSGTLKCFKIYL